MRQRRKIVALALSLLATVAVLFGSVSVAYAAEGGYPVPDAKKELISNEDGTYTLKLSVTGSAKSETESPKVNVVLVMDRSGSMRENTYAEAQYGRYGLVNGEYVQLYYEATYYGQRYYQQVGDDDNHDTVYTRSGNNYVQYTGTRYAESDRRRDQVAIEAATKLADNLLGYNDPANPDTADTVEMAFVSFNDMAADGNNGRWTTDKATADSVISNYTYEYNTGTNWEDALRHAKDLADAKHAAEPEQQTFIIFLTDGNPTRYINNRNQQAGTGYEDEDNINTCYEEAAPRARALTNAGYELYNIGVFGNVDRMQNLTTYANGATADGHGTATYYAAANASALESAFAEILRAITNSLSLADVKFTDGVTDMTHSTGVNGTPDSFTYTMTVNGVEEPWNDAPEATVNTNKEVIWDLSKDKDGNDLIIQDGVTVTCSFLVWPDQEAMDLIADLNNNKVSYDSLTSKQKAQITGSEGNYSLKTNTECKLDYSVLENKDGKISKIPQEPITLEPPKPMPLYIDKLSLEKKWEDSLDPDQKEEVEGEVKLDFYKDNEKYVLPGYEGGITLTEAENWVKENFLSIATGIMVSEKSPAYDASKYTVVTYDGTQYCILETGHDYHFQEQDINDHFELTAYTYHPMLVDGVLHNLTFEKDGSGNITGVTEGAEISTVSATNTIKGGVSITKKVVDEDGNEVDSDDPFTIVMHIQNPEEYDYRIYYGEKNPHYNDPEEGTENPSAEEKATNLQRHRSGHFIGTGSEVSVTIYQGDELRFVNVANGTEYYVDEDVTAGYTLDGITYQIHRVVDEEDVTGDYADDEKRVDGDTTWYIMQGNSSGVVEVTNTYKYGELDITKTVACDDAEKAESAKAQEFEFTVRLYADATKATELTSSEYAYTVWEDGAATSTTGTVKSGGIIKLKDGQTAKIEKLPEGAYYEVTEAAVQGYTTTKTGDTGNIVKNEAKTATFTNKYNYEDVYKPLTLTLNKVDANTGNKIDGAVFTLTKTDETTQDYTVTNGTVTIDFDKPGKYTLVEKTAPDGYDKLEGTWTIEVQKDTSKTPEVTYKEDKNVFEWLYDLIFGDVTKDPADGWTYNNGILTVENPPTTTEVVATKVWDDNSDQDGVRPDSVTFQLYKTVNGQTTAVKDADGNNVTAELSGKGDNTWTTTFKDLPAYEDGYKVTYSVMEMNASGAVVAEGGKLDDNYTASYGSDGLTVTNKHEIDKTKVTVTKNWNDNKNADKTRPESVSVTLYADGTAVGDPVTLNEGNNWTYTWENLDVNAAGKAISYTVDEAVVDGYAKSISDISGSATAGYSYTITNSNVTVDTNTTAFFTKNVTKANTVKAAKFDFSIEAVTVGAPMPENTTGNVSYDARETGEKAINFGKITFTKAGDYTYKITETRKPDGWTATPESVVVTVKVTGDAANGFNAEVTGDTIKNAYSVKPTKASFPVKKVLAVDEGLTAPDITGKYTFTLAAVDGAPLPETTSYTNPDKDGGTVTFGEIEYTAAGTYTYTVTETGKVDGVTNDIESSKTITVEVVDNGNGTLTATPSTDENAAVFTNTYEVGKVTASIPVEKTVVVPEGMTGPADWSYTVTAKALNGAPEATSMETTVTKATPTSKIGEIEFTKPGTYTYTVTETGKVAGVTNGTDSYDIEIVVTDNSNGTLTAVVNDGRPVAFENTYNVEPVTASFPVAKKLVVPEGLEGPEEWSYTIDVAANDGVPVAQPMTGTVNQDTKSVTFGDFTYTKPGTYTYTVSETGTVSGVTNDAEAAGKTVTVTVVDNGNGTMTAKADSTTDKPLTFTNTYATKSVSVPLTATKTVYGADSVEPFEFSIALKSDNAEGVELASETAKTASKIAEGESEQVSFGDATFTKPGTYVFTVDETTTTTDDKWVYDDSTHDITVKVTDDGTGQLSAEVMGDTPNFYNTYEDDVKTVTTGTSTTNIDGKPVQAGQTLTYTINWTAAAGGKTADVVVTDKVPEHTTLVGGSVSKPGVVSEDEDGNTVITWAFEGQAPGATGTVSFQVTVNEDAAGTTLTNDATVKSGENGANTNTVTNEVKTGSVGISKVIVSTTGVTDDEAEFAFEVSAKDSAGNPLKGSYDVTVAGEKTQKTFEDGKITFELKNGQVAVIDGLPEGTEYTVKETGEYAGYKLTAVDGEKDETEGKGTIAGGVDVEVHTFKFENTYSASGEAEIPVSKTVTSATEGTEPGDWSFDFTIAAGAYEGDAKDVTVPLPAERTVTLKGTGSNKKVSGKFGEIEYTAAGTYTYTVTESGTEGSANAGISTVGPKTVTVEVTDNKDGSLTATVKDADTAAAFENVYSVKTATLTIPVEKNLSVPEYLDGPSEWSYDINVEAVGNAPKAEVMTGKVDQDNTSITFGEFTYSQPGDYQYTVTETGKVDGVTNDVNGYTVKVNVKDNHDGTLTATANYDEKNPVIFTNTYDVDELKAAEPVKVDKWLTGTNLAAGMFQFEIKAGAYEGEAKDVTVPLPTQTQVANDAKGNVVFGEITFVVPGVYHYTVNEVNGGQQGYTYADNTVDVTITVTDNGNGTMSAETTYGEVKQFENSYKADGKAQFFASKTLKGHALEDGQFTFELVDSDGNVIQTKTNNGAQVVFDPIAYTQDDLLKASDEAAADDGTSDDTTADDAPADDAATTDDAAADAATDEAATDEAATDEGATDDAATDEAATREETADGATTETGNVSKAGSPEYDESATFTYTIREVDDGAAGYTYDKHDEKVTVTVTDNGDGKMNAAVAYDEDGAVFTNHYEATGEAQFNGIKTVEGTELKDGQFKFELVDGQGNVIETVANDADGSFSFSPIAYAQKDGQTDADTGTFEYTIREVNDGQLGYTYDSHVCDVIVTVTDNNNGTLTTAVEYSDGEKATFNNPYKPLATSAPVTAKKVLEGRDLKAGEFTFELRDAEGKVVTTATNAASGLVDFGYVSFDEVGTYTFTAAEVKGADANVTYDSSTKTYTVEVVDDGGQLVATITCDDPSATFTNVYEKQTPPADKKVPPKKKVIPQTGDDTPTGAMAALTVFGAAALTAGTVLQRRKRK